MKQEKEHNEETVDGTLLSGQHKKKAAAALASVVASVGLTVMKFIVGLLTGSMGILSEAVHSLLDFFAAGLTLIAVRMSAKPVDDQHHFGYGKWESVAALVETGLLFLTSLWVIRESIDRLFFTSVPVQVTWYAFAVIVVSIVVDFFRARALFAVAKETKSQALEADALHFSTDILSSLVVLIGLVFVSFGYPHADAIAALGVAGFVMRVGYQLGKRTLSVLIDTAPEGVTDRVRFALTNVAGIVRVARVRVRHTGPSVLVDVLLEVDRSLHAEALHLLNVAAERAIRLEVPEADVILHHRPVARSSESLVERIHAIAGRKGLLIHDVLVDEGENGKRNVSFDIAVPDSLSVGESSVIASRMEDALREELGEEVVVVTHIDPVSASLLQSVAVEGSELDTITAQIFSLARPITTLRDPHDIAVRRITTGGVFVSLHAYADPELSLRKAHADAELLEMEIRRGVEGVEYVKIHIEPSL